MQVPDIVEEVGHLPVTARAHLAEIDGDGGYDDEDYDGEGEGEGDGVVSASPPVYLTSIQSC